MSRHAKHTDFIRTLEPWPKFAEKYWWEDPDRPDLGCFGTGYNSWGVQTNQKYIGALAVLATDPELDEDAVGLSRSHLLERTLTALRFSLASHISGDHQCSDGTNWGHTWISGLGVERMMHAVEAIDEHLTDDDRTGLRRMLVSEADALLDLPVTGTLWAADGGNRPESNIWNGALLNRVALMYPDEPNVAAWVEKGTRFLLNGISLPKDAEDETIYSGRPLSEWHVGPNFFEHFALDHHGYLNVGYMVICISNMGMMHFACETAGWEPPVGLYHHGAELWQVIRRMIFSDGRLCRIGGDSRQRYCYCQDYLLPSLLFAGSKFDDEYAPGLEAGALDLIRHEQRVNGDRGFLSKRLQTIRESNPYYYTRLESDKAVVLAMNAYWRRKLQLSRPSPSEHFEFSVAGGWEEPEHGAIMHRSPRRIASWSWRARQRPMGLCLPPNASGLAEWDNNMAGSVRLMGATGGPEVMRHEQASFEGGFITWGAMDDRAGAVFGEGWKPQLPLEHQYAIAALPDDRTMVVMEYCAAPARYYLQPVTGIKGLKLNIPNDIFNGMERTYAREDRTVTFRGDGPANVTNLDSKWVRVDGRLGVVGIYGGHFVSLQQAGKRRASGYADSLYYDELTYPTMREHTELDTHRGEVLLDCASMVLSRADKRETRESAEMAEPVYPCDSMFRAVLVTGADETEYLFVTNFGDEAAEGEVALPGASATDLVSGEAFEARHRKMIMRLEPKECRLLRVDA